MSGISSDVIERLRSIVGEGYVITTTDDMEPYSHDELLTLKFMPDVVVKPRTALEISQIMKLANEFDVKVTPRGLGTGLSGGALPVKGGILLSTERMNEILEIDEANMVAVVEPAVIVGELCNAVEERKLFYPPDPASLDSCSIGGNVAHNAGGARAVKYGITRDYILGLEVVLPTGEIITHGGKYVKNVTGYNLSQYFIGSEGTLGIVTKIIVKLLPLPNHRVDLLVPFDDFHQAAEVVTQILLEHRIVPVVLEFMDKPGVKACESFLERELPFSDAEAQLIIGLDGNNEEELFNMVETIGEICLENGAEDVLVADNKATMDRLWEARRILLETLKAISEEVHVEDVVVPKSRIPELLSMTDQLAQKYKLPIVNWGHAGDGNVHVAILKKDVDEEVWNENFDGLVNAIFDGVVAMGGTITGEHGIGCLKKPYLPKAVGPAEIELMRKIKAALDPKNILNPGKIF